MAGKNQHYLWQMIQRGFGTKRGKKFHTWQFSQSGGVRQTVTAKIGSSEFFYNIDEDTDADVNITDFENSMAEFVHNLRQMGTKQKIDSEIVATLICHLETRTAFLRDEFSNVTSKLVELVDEQFSNPRTFNALMKSYLQTHPSLLSDELSKRGVLKDQISLIEDFVNVNFDHFYDSIVQNSSLPAGSLFDSLKDKIPEVIKEAHNKSLKDDFSTMARRDKYKSMRFRIVESELPLILPDTYMCFIQKHSVTPITVSGEKVEELILPLDSNHYLHGFSKVPIERSIATINKLLASSAYSFFIARENSLEMRNLTNRIGKFAKLVPQAQIEKMVTQEALIDRLSRD